MTRMLLAARLVLLALAPLPGMAAANPAMA